MSQNNTVPFEIIAAAFKMYLAPVGTAFPLIDAVPAVDWVLVGTSGDLNYMDDGITIDQPQTVTPFRALGDSGVRKVFRQDEDLKMGLVLVDLTLEQYKIAINHNTVATVPAGGEAGYKKIGLSRGLIVATHALLLRGPSPYMEDGNMQYEIPRGAQTGSPSVVMRRTVPAGLKLEWMALVDPAAATEAERFGRIIAQTAAAVS